MRAHHRSRTLAVQIEIADVEFAHRTIEFLARTGVDRAGQAKFSIVCDFKGVVEVARLDHGQHGSENFFLLQFRLRQDISNHSRLNEVAVGDARTSRARSAGDQASIFLADFYVAENVVHRTFVDYGCHVWVGGGIADRNALDPRFQFLQEHIVNALVDYGARSSRALLSLEAESRSGYAFYGGVDIGVGVNDDGVLAPHFEHGALDPDLAGLLLRGGLVDVQSYFARSGESYVANFRMSDQRVAKIRATAGAEVHHAFRHAAFFQQFHELRCNRRRIARGLEHHGVSADNRSHRHSGHDGAGKIPRRNHGAHSERNIGQRVALARQLDGRFGLSEAQSLAGVVLAEVDRLRDIGIGFEPVLGNFKDKPRHIFELALAHHIGDMKQQRRA